MNSTTRYILTATAVGVGLFTVGATANAIADSGTPAPNPIGDPVVVPTGASAPVGKNTDIEEVGLPDADDLASPTPTGVLDSGGWVTSPGNADGDDDHGRNGSGADGDEVEYEDAAENNVEDD